MSPRPRATTLLLLALLGPSAARAAPQQATPARKPNRYEFGAVPVLAGDTDIGVAFGALGALVRFERGYRPYRWRIQALMMMSVKRGPDGDPELPYHDDYIKADFPGLLGGALRLNARVSFGRYLTSGYYGIGNAAVEKRPWEAPGLSAEQKQRARRFNQYDRIYPRAQLQARIALLPRLSLLLGAAYTHNWIEIYPQSKLAADLAAGDERLRRLLRGTDRHGVAELQLGWIYDSRDHEYVPSRGMFHELSWRFSPGVALGTEHPYGGVDLNLRFFAPLYGTRLVAAARLMVDLLVGAPPFYELARYGGLEPDNAIGGRYGVRGVPAQRYHGKIKIFGNLELRARLLPFSLFKQRFNIGLTAFCDAGRVWSDWSQAAVDAFDGGAVGIKLGLGGGLRIQWGETFLIRADVAWSPDADPIGFYIATAHVF